MAPTPAKSTQKSQKARRVSLSTPQKKSSKSSKSTTTAAPKTPKTPKTPINSNLHLTLGCSVTPDSSFANISTSKYGRPRKSILSTFKGATDKSASKDNYLTGRNGGEYKNSKCNRQMINMRVARFRVGQSMPGYK